MTVLGVATRHAAVLCRLTVRLCHGFDCRLTANRHNAAAGHVAIHSTVLAWSAMHSKRARLAGSATIELRIGAHTKPGSIL